MRLLFRPEQMSVIQASAEEKFVRRLGSHIRRNYSKAVVMQPEDQRATVSELSDETMDSLVRVGIDRARKLNFTYESSISAFTALMFEVAPNFDLHELVQPFLANEEIAPNVRLDAMLERLTEKDWETVRKTYDVNAWQPIVVKEETSATAEEKPEE